MSQTRKIVAVVVVIVVTLVAQSLVLSAPDEPPNICNIGEFWEGHCLSTPDWEAGWYLHPANDPGDGLAVTIAYSNYAALIVHMPHSMCIDWRSANCDRTIPPDPPVHTKKEKKARRTGANSPGACIRQANSRSSIDRYCRALHDYDASLSSGDEGFNAKLEAASATFVAGLTSSNECAAAAANVASNGGAYTAGSLSESAVEQMESDIVSVLSWTCVTYYDQTPPAIPDPPN